MEPDSSTIEFALTNRTYLVDLEQVHRIADKIQQMLGVSPFELDLDFISSEEIQQLNLEYRDKDNSTDVLSFPQQEWDVRPTVQTPFQEEKQSPIPQMLGDLVISLEDAERNASDIGQGLDREICFLLIHGILHLCGYDHEEPIEESIMLEQQQLILAKLQSEPPPIWKNCVRLKF